MNNKHLLAKLITLLQHESMLPNSAGISNTLAERILGIIKLPEVSMGMDIERDITKNLMSTVRRMVELSDKGGIPTSELKQQLIIDCADDDTTYRAVTSGLDVEIDPDVRQNLAGSIRSSLNAHVRGEAAKEILFNTTNMLRFKPEEAGDIRQVLLKLMNDIEPFAAGAEEESPGVVRSFSLSDVGEVNDIFSKVKERQSGLGGIRFAWQDWNRMFKGTIEFGKTLVLGALQHHHKSGTFRGIVRSISMYNIPRVEEWLEMPAELANPNVIDIQAVDITKTTTSVEIPVFAENVGLDIDGLNGDAIIGYEVIDISPEDWERHERAVVEFMQVSNAEKTTGGLAELSPAVSLSPTGIKFPFTKPEDDDDLYGHKAFEKAVARGFKKDFETWRDLVSGTIPQDPDEEEVLDFERFVYYLDPYTHTHVPVMALKDPFYGRIPKYKPAIVHISTEDEIEDTMIGYFEAIYFNVEGVPAKKSDFSPAQMAEYVTFHMQRNGWEVFFIRANPSEWTYMDVCQVTLRLESKGYKVYALGVDYYPMIPTTGCTEGPAGYALRDMYRRGRNFHSARNIFFFTPHQLSSDAMRLLRQGVDEFVKQLPDRNYYADSTQISHEVDAEVFQHIEKNINGVSWLTWQRGKYRSTKIVDEKDKYSAMPFHPEGGLQDDLLRNRLSRNAVGGTISTEGNDEDPMWAFG